MPPPKKIVRRKPPGGRPDTAGNPNVSRPYTGIYPRESPNQPHHAGAAIIFGPDGDLLASSQGERIRDEMVVATLEAEVLAKYRSLANYTLRTRRPELFGEIVQDQVCS